MRRCKRALTCVRPLVRPLPFLPGASRQWSAPCFALRASESGIPLDVLRRRLAAGRSLGLLAMRRASTSRRGHRCLLQTRESRSQEESTKVCAWLTSSLPKHAYLTARLGDNPKRVLSKVPVCHLRPIRMNNGPTGNHRNASVSFLCADHSPAVHPRRNEPFASTRDRKSVV